MDRDEIEAIMNLCLQKLYQQDGPILEQDVGERAICGRLAMLMAPRFPEFSVDIEYNRIGVGVEPKDIEFPDENGVLTTRNVFPDIIVHERGHNRRNLLVVEAKKSTNLVGDEHDHAKLRLLVWQLRYRHGLFLRLSTGLGARIGYVRKDWFEGPPATET